MVNKNRRVGDELRVRREELGYSLHKVEVATKIRGRYLRAIETSDFTHLPNDVYSRGFVRQYAQYLGLSGDNYARRYQSERGGKPELTQQVRPRALALRLGVSSRLTASLLALGAIALIAGYLIWQFSSLTSAPDLQLTSPVRDEVVTSSSLKVAGTTNPGVDVLLNDVPLPSDLNGSFSTTLLLQPGVNEVRIVAKNKLGKQTRVTRNILSKQTKADQLPTQIFDGVAVLVTSRDDTKIVIVADGKTVYDGAMSKGSTRLVSAQSLIRVTASDSSAVTVKLTNAAVAGFDFGVLGPDAAARTIEFTKNTQVPGQDE
jgi:cytoskeletal protein RodZ